MVRTCAGDAMRTIAQTQKARNANGSSGTTRANERARKPTTSPTRAMQNTIGSSATATAALMTKRRSRNGSASSANGRATKANRTPNTIRNGNVSSQNMNARLQEAPLRSLPLFTRRGFYKFRRLELIRRSARRVRRQIGHRLVRHALVEALDDGRGAAR